MCPVQLRITFKLISPAWSTFADNQQHPLEKLHNFLLHKKAGVAGIEPATLTPPPHSTHSMIETTDASCTDLRMSPSATNHYLSNLLNSQNCQNYLGQAAAVAAAAAAVKKESNCHKMPQSLCVDTQSSSPSPPPNTESVHIIGRMAGGTALLKQGKPSDGGHSPVSGTVLSGTPNSLFTIDSILAPKSSSSGSNPSSPQSPSNNTHSPTPFRPTTRVPGLLHHPGLHLGHLAAAAAQGFGATSDFLGE